MTSALPQELIQRLAQLRSLSEVSIQDAWFVRQGETLSPAAPNEKGYLVWEKGLRPAEFIQEITAPERLNAYPTQGSMLRLALTWWAEAAEIYVNGEFVQSGDLFDSKTRILLTPNVQIGQIFSVTLKLISPGHDIGGLMESRLIFEKSEPELEPSFIADELTVLAQYLAQSAPEQLEDLTVGLAELPWDKLGKNNAFDQALSALRERLKPLAQDLKRRSFHLLGHAHLDLAWLWPLRETWEAAERTFRSVLSLQQEFPDLIFGHTSPALYEWMEINRPELFEEIKTAVEHRRWELLGGMWVEPDVNLPGAESLVRQLLYGQRYFLSRFGQLAKVAWLPDSFGFCQQLPQLFKQAGIEVFFTGKLHWNDTNQFPHGIFNWQAPDGTECLTLMSPPNLAGVMDTQPRPMADYGRFWEEQTGLTAMLWLPGVGDHGGGPSRDMWRVKRRWQNSPFFPAIKTGRAEDYVQQLQTESGDKFDNLPIWTEDLYLELHRGCYTTHGEQKNYNRRSEYLLYEAELWSSFAVWFTGAAYPRQELESAWKKVLLNQFHDILPGTSIPEVFEDANADWSQVLQTGEALVNQALEALSSRIQFPAPSRSQAQPFVVFNSLNQTHSEVVAIPYLAQVFDLEGNSLTTQLTPAGETLFACENIPALGYRSYWLLDRSEPERQRETLTPHLPLPPSATLREREQGDKGDRWILDNGVLKVTLDAATGEIASLYDYRHQRDVLDGNGNQLQFFQDQGQYWDAWNIDPDYENHPLESAELIGAELLENGPLRWRLRVEKSFRDSRFQQDYVLEAQSPLLKIINRVRWQERRVLVKVAFPLSFSADTFTAETPGAVRIRPARPQTPQERAQWEIPHRQWLDLTNPDLNYGVSLLNDCKYGADAGPNRLRLSLLRGSLWPDPQADWGDCEFTYALLPHGGDWRGAVPVGNQLNCPLRVYCPPCLNPEGPLSPRQSLLNLNNESLGLLALKPREDDPQTWVIRVNDPLGRQSQLNPQAPVPLRVERRLDLLERPLDSVSDRVNPWEIATFQVRLGKEPSALPTV